MKISSFLFSLLLFLVDFASAQQWIEEKRIKVTGNLMCIDNLNNIFVYNERVIEKFNPSGKLMYSYSSTSASNITKMDVLNPLRILIFYKDINQIKFLDNTLSETGITVSFNLIDLQLASLVCNSANKGFWVYNPQNIELLHLDNNLEIISRTGNLSSVLNLDLNPSNMFEYNNQLYLCNLNSLLMFDIFGTFKKTVDTPCRQCFVSDNFIYNCQSDSIVSYNFMERKSTVEKSISNYSVQLYNGKMLYLINRNNELIIYRKE